MVDQYQYIILDQGCKRREDLGGYKSLSVPCKSGASPPSERLNKDGEYDDVMTDNGNSSDKSPGGYEEPGVVNSE